MPKIGDRTVSRRKLSEIRNKPGMSNAGKYKNVKDFVGPNGTFPINTVARARNALARLHFAAPGAQSGIKTKIYAKYPSLREVEK